MRRTHHLLHDLATIEQQLTQLVRGQSLFPSASSQGAAWTPPVDIYETAEAFVLTAELPGVESSAIDIRVIGETLVLRGERRWERESHRSAQEEHFLRLESAYGKFERSFRLSQEIDSGQITADLDRGVLKVILPKRTPVPPSGGREIRIQGSAPPPISEEKE
ncbi:MAG: Hsp20/alpha crystallin family protein [Blastocatellia bacterium]